MLRVKLSWLAICALISSLGMSFIWPLTSVYLHNQLHISLTTIGVVLLFNSLTSVLGSSLGGYMYDKFNPYYFLLSVASATFIILVCLTIWHGWPIFGFWLSLLGFCSGWNIALLNSISTSLQGVSSKHVFNTLYLFQNLGVVIGSSLVGYFYAISVSLLFGVAAALFIAFILIIKFTFNGINTKHVSTTKNKQDSEPKNISVSNRILLAVLFFSLLIIWTMYQQWTSNVSVYMTDLGFPLSQYSILWTINAGGIVLIQIILNYLNQDIISTRAQIYFGIASLALSFIVLSFAHRYLGFIGAMLLLTVGEATAFPAIPALVNRLSSSATKGKYQGAVNAWASAGRAIGPLIGGVLIESTSYNWLFRVAVLLYIFVLVLMIFTFHFFQRKVTYFN